MMFVVYTVVVVYRKLVGELKDCCSNNGGLEKKKKSVFKHRPSCCSLLNNVLLQLFIVAISTQVSGKLLD